MPLPVAVTGEFEIKSSEHLPWLESMKLLSLSTSVSCTPALQWMRAKRSGCAERLTTRFEIKRSGLVVSKVNRTESRCSATRDLIKEIMISLSQPDKQNFLFRTWKKLQKIFAHTPLALDSKQAALPFNGDFYATWAVSTSMLYTFVVLSSMSTRMLLS